MDISNLDHNAITKMNDHDFTATLRALLNIDALDRKESALLHYQPVSEHAKEIHLSTAQTVGVGGGNRSSKTETCLVHMMMCATGIIPYSLRDDIKPSDLPPPAAYRVVCESLTNVLSQIILPKLQWWHWTGIDTPGGKRGHYGWIPRNCLIGGSWDKSWSEKKRVLRVLCRDPDDDRIVRGESTIQYMSHDQDATDFASGEFRMILHDEPPKYAIWLENQARAMSVNGRMFLAMTWPDDPAIAVDWLFDKVYEPATRAAKDPDIDWFNLYSIDNPNLDQDAIARQMGQWDAEMVKVRIYGQPIRFSNRVHVDFTDQDQVWCFPCGKTTVVVDEHCANCKSATLAPFNHVREFDAEPNWPTVFMLDPHPRKPHMFSWWQISPQDDLWCIADGECAGDTSDTFVAVSDMESSLGLTISHRYIDPNMGRSPASARQRNVTWQDEFANAGLYCDLANDAIDVGIERINEYLKPDKNTLDPRIHLHERCRASIRQMKRYVWDDHKKALEKSMKQKPKDKDNDYPSLLRYLVNENPTFEFERGGTQIIHRSRGNGVRHAQRR